MQFTNLQERAQPVPRALSSLIGSIGSLLGAEWFANAERAQLKRYRAHHGGPGEMVALRLLVFAGSPIEAIPPEELGNWIWLVHFMALLSGPNRDPHSTSIEARPGRVLHQAGYNEFRLCRLLEARGERFQTLLERALRRIARLGEPLNWSKLAPLILADDTEGGPEHARIEIARDFAAAAARSDFRNSSIAPDNAQESLPGYDTHD